MKRIEDEFNKRKPWITQFTINGKKYGGSVSFDDDTRIRFFFDIFPDVKSVLELGCLEGGHTFQLVKKPGISVLGIEGREYNIDKANYIKELLQIQNARFICADLENTSLSTFGKFDAVFCSGILYHLPNPWNLIHEISKITEKVFIWTHYATEEQGILQIHGYRGFWYKEFGLKMWGLKKPLKGLSKKSFWMTKNSLISLLIKNGFNNLKVLEDDVNHKNGAAITLGAWK